jgi:Ca2+-binding RTX toxin-like protein
MSDTALDRLEAAFSEFIKFEGSLVNLSNCMIKLVEELPTGPDAKLYGVDQVNGFASFLAGLGYAVSGIEAIHAINQTDDPAEIAAQIFGFFYDSCFQVLNAAIDASGPFAVFMNVGLTLIETGLEGLHVKEGAMDEIRYLIHNAVGFQPDTFAFSANHSSFSFRQSQSNPNYLTTTGTGNDRVNVGSQAANFDGGGGTNTLVADYSAATDSRGYDIGPIYIDANGSATILFSESGFSRGSTTFALSNFQNRNITGTDGDDSIYGGTGTNILKGGGGNDFLYANTGVDLLDGGAGNNNYYNVGLDDTVIGGAGFDSLQFDLSGTTTGVTINLLTDQDTGVNWTGIEAITGKFGSGNDNVTVGAQLSDLDGGAGTDSLTLDYSAAFVSGQPVTAINMIEGSGNDRSLRYYSYYATADVHLSGFESFTITGTSGGDAFVGASGGNHFYGLGGDDNLTGGAGADLLDGGAGNDSFPNVDPSDTVIGGSGTDWVRFDLSGTTTGVTINLLTDQDTGVNWTGIEAITGKFGSGNDNVTVGAQLSDLDGGAGTDSLTLDYSAAFVSGQPVTAINMIEGSGNDRSLRYYSYYATADVHLSGFESFTITGTSGGDAFVGASGGNHFYGLGGDDNLTGGAGADLLDGGAGNDTLYGESDNDTLTGGAGDDFLDGGTGIDWLDGGIGNDRLVVASAGSGSTVDGGTGTDTLAVSGAVSLGGIAGIEGIELAAGSNLTLTTSQLMAGLAPNTQLSGSGTITVQLEANVFTAMTSFQGPNTINFVLNGSSGDDYIKAAHFNNTINGGTGRDFIRGGNGVHTIDGGADNDKITGWGGADILTGGSGSDQFRYFYATDSGTGAAADRITDFTIGSDVIDLRLLDKDLVTQDIQNYTLGFIGNSAFGAGGTGQIRYATSGADMLVQFDLDGNGTSDMEIVLQGLAGQTLSVNDFLFGTNPTGGSEALSGMAASEPTSQPAPDLAAAFTPSGAALVPIDTLRASPVSVVPIEFLTDPMALPGHELGFSLTQHADLLHLV